MQTLRSQPLAVALKRPISVNNVRMTLAKEGRLYAWSGDMEANRQGIFVLGDIGFILVGVLNKESGVYTILSGCPEVVKNEMVCVSLVVGPSASSVEIELMAFDRQANKRACGITFEIHASATGPFIAVPIASGTLLVIRATGVATMYVSAGVIYAVSEAAPSIHGVKLPEGILSADSQRVSLKFTS